MKKVIYTTLFLLALLVSLVGTAAAAPATSGNATLIGVSYVEGKGVVFTFHVTGNLSKSDLKGSVSVDGGGNYGLDCVKVDSETVKCTAPKAVAGHDVIVSWGGSTFWTHVAGIPSGNSDPSQYCYGIWDFWSFTDNEWVDFGPHCQDEPAQEGDEINYVIPANTYPGQDEPFTGWGAWFVNDPDVCGVPNHGAAYYWAPECF